MADLTGVSRVAATEPVSRRGMVLRGWCGIVNSPKGVSGVNGDWKVARDIGWVTLELWRQREYMVVVL
jgi:hypothetical protein